MKLSGIQPDDPKPAVLVIDDSHDVHRLLRARLRNEDLELVGAGSGEAGLKIASESPPAIILLDLDMPGIDGFEVLRSLKDDPATMDIPVIVLSGLQSSQDKVAAFDLGAVDYITKPFDLTELRVRVRSALRLYRLLKMLAERAHVDGLTGLWNRAHFDRRWSDEVAGFQRHHRPLALAMIDADLFKSVNDTFGHPAGDAVLQGIARVLLRECRQSDVACRYGGEEFALIMPGTTMRDAHKVCERIRLTLEGATWPKHPDRRVTLSVGIAGSDTPPGPAPHVWLEIADQALLQSKRAGRNRTTVADITPDGPRLARAG